eukprot:768750-Hanusia_phi.AAC.8
MHGGSVTRSFPTVTPTPPSWRSSDGTVPWALPGSSLRARQAALSACTVTVHGIQLTTHPCSLQKDPPHGPTPHSLKYHPTLVNFIPRTNNQVKKKGREDEEERNRQRQRQRQKKRHKGDRDRDIKETETET